MWRHWWGELSKGHRLVRFDQRDNELPDRNVDDISLEVRVSDLETVVDALELEPFALRSISQGGPAAAEYSARHPERITHLIIYGGFAMGQTHRSETPEETEEREALNTLMMLGWGRENPSYRQIFTARFIQEAIVEDMGSFN